MNVDPLNATLHDVAEFLKVQGVAFALIGGLAVAVRGEPRSTLDVDIIIDCDVAASEATWVVESNDGSPRFNFYHTFFAGCFFQSTALRVRFPEVWEKVVGY